MVYRYGFACDQRPYLRQQIGATRMPFRRLTSLNVQNTIKTGSFFKNGVFAYGARFYFC